MPEIPNTQWTYIIVNHTDGEVFGTDDVRVAKACSTDPDMAVIDIKRGVVHYDPTEDATVMPEANIPEQHWFKFN